MIMKCGPSNGVRAHGLGPRIIPALGQSLKVLLSEVDHRVLIVRSSFEAKNRIWKKQKKLIFVETETISSNKTISRLFFQELILDLASEQTYFLSSLFNDPCHSMSTENAFEACWVRRNLEN